MNHSMQRLILTLILGVAAQAAHASEAAKRVVPVMPQASGIAISGQSAFDKALASARGGETFNLADGSYRLSVSNIRPRTIVTVQGSRNAVFRSYGKITSSSNLRFSGVTFSGDADMKDGQWVLQLAASENITFDNVLISGVDNSGYGIFVRTNDVKNITIRNSEITKLKYGGVIWGGTGWLLEKNIFHVIASDGLQLSGTFNSKVIGNRLSDFQPHSGFHPDGIQLTGPNTDLTLQGNIVRGDAQGLFYDGRRGRQKNLRVIDNDIAVSYPNAIRFDDAEGVLSGNKVSKAGRHAPIVRMRAMKSE